jgi:hypothetical protein
MVRTHIKKLANPRRIKRKARNARKRRRMSPKQIRIFGTKRQKAALKAASKRKRSNPRRIVVRKRTVKRARRSHHNPALIVTLGAANPHRRSKPVATKRRRRRAVNKSHRRRRHTNPRRVVRRRRRSNPVAHRRRRRSNAKKVVIRYRNKRRNSSRRRHASRRNPSLFGASITSKQGLMIVGGALTGVVVSKFAPTLLPTSLTGSLGSSSFGPTILTGASALAAGWIAGKWDRGFGDAVLLGGLVQTVSVALNAFLPSVYQQLGIGLGDLMNGQFAVPQNPIRAGIAPPPPPPSQGGGQARITMSGLARAYGNAF